MVKQWVNAALVASLVLVWVSPALAQQAKDEAKQGATPDGAVQTNLTSVPPGSTAQLDMQGIRDIAELSAALVDDRIAQRQAFYWSLVGGGAITIAAVLAFFGVTRIGDIRRQVSLEVRNEVINSDSLKGDIRTIIEREFEERFREQTADLQEKILVLENSTKIGSLQKAANDFASGESYSKEDLEHILSLINSIAYKEYLDKDQSFIDALTTVIRLFAQSNRSANLKDVIDKFWGALQESARALNILSQYYGRELVGSMERDPDVLAIWAKIREASISIGYPEFVLPYDLVANSAIDKDAFESTLAAHVARFNALTDQEKEIFQKTLGVMCDARQMGSSMSSQHMMIEQRTKQFVETYGEHFRYVPPSSQDLTDF